MHIYACRWEQIVHLFIILWYQHGCTDTEFLKLQCANLSMSSELLYWVNLNQTNYETDLIRQTCYKQHWKVNRCKCVIQLLHCCSCSSCGDIISLWPPPPVLLHSSGLNDSHTILHCVTTCDVCAQRSHGGGPGLGSFHVSVISCAHPAPFFF